MVCIICGKHSDFCISRAQSIHCAVMQHMTAVGHRHVRPMPTNTCRVKPPIEHSVGYRVGRVTKKWFSRQRTQPFKEDVSYHLDWLSITVDALVPSKAPFSNPSFCPPNCRWLVTVLPQGNVELHFDLFFTAYFNGGWWGQCGKVVEIDDSCFSRQSVTAAGCVQQHGFLLLSSRNWDTCLVHVTDRSTETLPSLRRVSYPAPQSSVTAEGTTFVSTVMDSPLAQSLCQFRGTRILSNTIEATRMYVKFTLRPYWENKVICVINGLKGCLLARFDDVWELIVKCSV